MKRSPTRKISPALATTRKRARSRSESPPPIQPTLFAAEPESDVLAKAAPSTTPSTSRQGGKAAAEKLAAASRSTVPLAKVAVGERAPSRGRESRSPRTSSSDTATDIVQGPDLRAWVDGGARGNPGPAGYGAYIEDTKGGLVSELSGFLGVTTNNVAEYQGLLAALRAAHELGARSLSVQADSQLIVRQMTGEYRVKDEKLRPLFLAARALAAGIPRFSIRHIRREENREADRLANEAMDRGKT